MRKSKKRADII